MTGQSVSDLVEQGIPGLGRAAEPGQDGGEVDGAPRVVTQPESALASMAQALGQPAAAPSSPPGDIPGDNAEDSVGLEARGAPSGELSSAARDMVENAVDLLNRSLLIPLLPVDALRGVALGAVATIAPLRRAVLAEGIMPALAPPLMRRSG